MKKFQEYELDQRIHRALEELKFEKTTEVQFKSIDSALEGRDILGCAETGSGKTGAYAIPMVQRLLEDHLITGLVLAPTRELAHQISDFYRDLTKYIDGFAVTALVGGADMRKQTKALKRKPRVIVATPGRLTDHIKRKNAQVDRCEILALDEADRMLDMGFAPQLNEILRYVPKNRQTSMYTATLPKPIKALSRQYLIGPVCIESARASLPVKAIKQTAIKATMKEKDELVVDELNKRSGSVIIFARTKNRTNILTRILQDYGFAVDVIHGGRTQGQRNKAIRNFKNGRSRILCATDIAARGIDIPQVEHVINFDLPMVAEDYVHRIGRTARNGASGEAVSFVMPTEVRDWQNLCKKFEIKGAHIEGDSKSSGGKSSGRKSSGRKTGQRSGGGAGTSMKNVGRKQAKRKAKFSKSSSDEAATSGGKKKKKFSSKKSASGAKKTVSGGKKATGSKKKFGGKKKTSQRGGKSSGGFGGVRRKKSGSGAKRQRSFR